VKAIGILVAAHLLLNLLGCFVDNVPLTSGMNVLVGFPLLMLAPSQGALLGFWIAIGGKRTSWRVPLAFLSMVAYLGCVAKLGSKNDDFYIPFVLLAFCVSSVLLPLRFLGLRIVRGGFADRQRPQFSLMNALVWMTTFAVLFGAIQWRSFPLHRVAVGLGVAFLAVMGICTAVSVASLWSALGSKWMTARILVLFVTVAAVPCIMTTTVGSVQPLIYYGLLLAIEAAWIVSSLLVVRLAGYRLMWHWRLGRLADNSEPPTTASLQREGN